MLGTHVELSGFS